MPPLQPHISVSSWVPCIKTFLIPNGRVDHCLETLRLNVMCTADVTPVMIVADDTAPLGRYVDFNTMHKCRNFWDIRAWVDQNKVMD